jgi:hypothetical protein
VPARTVRDDRVPIGQALEPGAEPSCAWRSSSFASGYRREMSTIGSRVTCRSRCRPPVGPPKQARRGSPAGGGVPGERVHRFASQAPESVRGRHTHALSPKNGRAGGVHSMDSGSTVRSFACTRSTRSRTSSASCDRVAFANVRRPIPVGIPTFDHRGGNEARMGERTPACGEVDFDRRDPHRFDGLGWSDKNGRAAGAGSISYSPSAVSLTRSSNIPISSRSCFGVAESIASRRRPAPRALRSQSKGSGGSASRIVIGRSVVAGLCLSPGPNRPSFVLRAPSSEAGSGSAVLPRFPRAHLSPACRRRGPRARRAD